MTREQYESLPAVQLKEIARARGLKVTGGMRKSAVVELMLAEDEKDGQKNAADAKAEEPIAAAGKTEPSAAEMKTERRPAEEKTENTAAEAGEAGERSDKPPVDIAQLDSGIVVQFWKCCRTATVLSAAIIIFRGKTTFMYHRHRSADSG